MNSLIKCNLVILFCLTGSLLWVDNASGAKPTEDVIVDAFDPGSALQGQNLDLTISGSGFDDGSTVRLLIPATEKDPEDDTQVEVIGEILFIKGKGKAERLIVPIHVLNAAPDVNYEVEVTTSGRRGKGTDLFKVELNTTSENRSETGTNECNDGIDNDGDDKIDGEDDDCFGAFDPDQPKTSRGKREPLRVTLDDGEYWDGSGWVSRNLLSDGNPYVDGESRVKAAAGGQRPHRIQVVFRNHGNNLRRVTVTVQCDPIPESSEGAGDRINRCIELDDIYGSPFTITVGYHFAVIPYTVNCPESDTPCPDVFTMGESTQRMSFKLFKGLGPTIEAASDIGGATSIDPGRCLSLLTAAQRNAFLARNCTNTVDGTEVPAPENCNVTIEALDIVDQDGVFGQDGENDFWRIDANGIKTLICADGIVYGQTALTFSYDAVKK
jgi:hypothetical protein